MPLTISREEFHRPDPAGFLKISESRLLPFREGRESLEDALKDYYRNGLEEAASVDINSLTIQLPEDREGRFKEEDSFRIVKDIIISFLETHEMDICLIIHDRRSPVKENRHYEEAKAYVEARMDLPLISCSYHPKADDLSNLIETEKRPSKKKYSRVEEKASRIETDNAEKIDSRIFEPDESFSECLIRMIREKDLKDPDVYKKANIDRKHFNHIVNKKDYKPKKETAVALAIGMKLNLKETGTLLERAGFVLSKSSRFDLIIRYCIVNRIYDIFEVNEILFAQDQKTLGC